MSDQPNDNVYVPMSIGLGTMFINQPVNVSFTIRDYFAAAALQGNLAGQSIDVGYYEGKDAWNKAAKDAYAMADAMLKAREAKP